MPKSRLEKLRLSPDKYRENWGSILTIRMPRIPTSRNSSDYGGQNWYEIETVWYKNAGQSGRLSDTECQNVLSWVILQMK